MESELKESTLWRPRGRPCRELVQHSEERARKEKEKPVTGKEVSKKRRKKGVVKEEKPNIEQSSFLQQKVVLEKVKEHSETSSCISSKISETSSSTTPLDEILRLAWEKTDINLYLMHPSARMVAINDAAFRDNNFGYATKEEAEKKMTGLGGNLHFLDRKFSVLKDMIAANKEMGFMSLLRKRNKELYRIYCGIGKSTSGKMKFLHAGMLEQKHSVPSFVEDMDVILTMECSSENIFFQRSLFDTAQVPIVIIFPADEKSGRLPIVDGNKLFVEKCGLRGVKDCFGMCFAHQCLEGENKPEILTEVRGRLLEVAEGKQKHYVSGKVTVRLGERTNTVKLLAVSFASEEVCVNLEEGGYHPFSRCKGKLIRLELEEQL